MKSYYVLTHLNEQCTMVENPTEFFKFKVKGERVPHRYVQLFLWYNPVAQSWMMHEVSTGSFISEGRTKKDTVDRGFKAMRNTGENKFFDALIKIGRIGPRTEISFKEAMRRMAITSGRIKKSNTGETPQLPDFVDNPPRI